MRLKERAWLPRSSLSVGPTAAQEQLRTALALGADRAILVESNDELNSWPWPSCSRPWSQPQLVILGKQAIDSDNNQTGQMLAALTGYAQGNLRLQGRGRWRQGQRDPRSMAVCRPSR